MKRTIAAILTILALGVLPLAAQDVETVTAGGAMFGYCETGNTR